MYIYERKNWPKFLWNQEYLTNLLIQVHHSQGRLIGGMESIGFRLQEDVILQTLTQDIIKSSEIEGEILDRALVRSSVARHLGIEHLALNRVDRNVEGVVDMMLDATQKFHQPLTKERLFKWHASLFPDGHSGFMKITVGAWRRGSVEVISGQLGEEIVHFTAPAADKVELEMKLFLDWLNEASSIDLVLKAAIAHLWFITIHPFDDGNGRIGRALVDMVLARREKSPRRFYSLSAQIQLERKNYYEFLEKTQKGDLDITSWIEWFLGCLIRAVDTALGTLDIILYKEKFWKSLADVSLNERQRKVINRILDGFEGNLTSSKWAKITKCSQDTAYRDILDLIDQGVLIKNAEGGRSTSYSLANFQN